MEKRLVVARGWGTGRTGSRRKRETEGILGALKLGPNCLDVNTTVVNTVLSISKMLPLGKT